MANNMTLTEIQAGAAIRADEIAGVKNQGVKIILGIEDADDGYVSDTTPMPVDDAGGSLTVDGNSIGIRHSTDIIMNAATALTPKFAVINLAATGTIVGAVTTPTNKKIRVLSLHMTIDVLTGDETYTFKSGAAGTPITGDLGEASAAASVIFINYPFSPVGHFETVSGSLLELALGVAGEAQGSLCYVEV